MNDVRLIDELAEKYAVQYTSPEDDVLKEINQHTTLNHEHAHMLSGHVQGKFLSFISIILEPSHVLDIGTFTGYSAICLSEGLRKDGALHTIEIREQDADIARKNIGQSKNATLIHLHVGNALDIIPTIPVEWDLVFIDADKTGYIDYYEMVVPRLSARGIIIADNVLFHGHVLKEPIVGKNAKAISDFNNHVANDPRVEQVLLTLRDGLLLIKKK